MNEVTEKNCHVFPIFTMKGKYTTCLYCGFAMTEKTKKEFCSKRGEAEAKAKEAYDQAKKKIIIRRHT